MRAPAVNARLAPQNRKAVVDFVVPRLRARLISDSWTIFVCARSDDQRMSPKGARPANVAIQRNPLVDLTGAVRLPSLLPERKRQFSQPSLDPVRLDIREILTVNAGRALVGTALGTGVLQNILAADRVVYPDRRPARQLRFHRPR